MKLEKISPTSLRARMGREAIEVEEAVVELLAKVVNEARESTVVVRDRPASEVGCEL